MARLEKVFGMILLIVFGGIVLHAPLSVGLGTVFPDYLLQIKSWKEVLIIIATVIAAVIVYRRGLWRTLSKDLLLRIIAAYIVLHVVISIVLYQGLAPTLAGLAIDLRHILFFSLVYILIKIAPHYRRRVIKIGIIGALIVVTFAVMQLFLPADSLKYIGYSKQTIAPYMTVDENPEFIRINSTLRGPNPLGVYAVIVLTMAVAFAVRRASELRQTRMRYLVYWCVVASSAALWASYSRSALFAGIGAVGLVFAMTSARRIPRKAKVVSFVILFSVIGGLIIARDSSFVSNVILHENPNGGSSISSNDGHATSVADGIRRVLSEPFGAGVGSTGSASLLGDQGLIIENQYLFIGHEVGIAGVVLFITLFSVIIHRLYRRRDDWLALGLLASGIGLALVGLLLPVWVDDTVSIIWFGFAGLALAGKETYGTTTTNKKTTRTT